MSLKNPIKPSLIDLSIGDEKTMEEILIPEKCETKSRKKVKFSDIEVIEIQSYKKNNKFNIDFEEKYEQKVPRKDLTAEILINIQQYDKKNEKTNCCCIIF